MRRLALLLIVVATLSSCSTVDSYAAIVNGKTISTSLIEDELETVVASKKYAEVVDQSLSAGTEAGGLQPNGKNTVNATYTAQLLYNRVLVALIEEEFTKRNLTITPGERQQAEQIVRSEYGDNSVLESLPQSYRDYLFDRQAKLTAVVRDRNSPQAQRSYYDANSQRFSQTCVRHVLVAEKSKADALRARIIAGEEFAAIAKVESIDNQGPGSSAENGGDLGCYSDESLEQLITPFRDAVRTLPVNEVSQPVETSYGFHLILVTSRGKQSFEAAQPDIARVLGNSSQFLTEVVTKAKIKVNPRFGDFKVANPLTGEAAELMPHPAKELSEGRPRESDEVPTGMGSVQGGSLPPQ